MEELLDSRDSSRSLWIRNLLIIKIEYTDKNFKIGENITVIMLANEAD